jgi:hypothetical protein
MPNSFRLAKPSIADNAIAKQYPKTNPIKREQRDEHGKNSF